MGWEIDINGKRANFTSNDYRLEIVKEGKEFRWSVAYDGYEVYSDDTTGRKANTMKKAQYLCAHFKIRHEKIKQKRYEDQN